MPAFKLVSQYFYWWPVKVTLPNPDKPGTSIEQTFEMQFEALPLEEVHAIDSQAAELAIAGDKAGSERTLLARVCKNWRGVEDDDGGAIAFSEEAFRNAMRFPYFRAGCYAAYAESQSGRARLGN